MSVRRCQCKHLVGSPAARNQRSTVGHDSSVDQIHERRRGHACVKFLRRKQSKPQHTIRVKPKSHACMHLSGRNSRGIMRRYPVFWVRSIVNASALLPGNTQSPDAKTNNSHKDSMNRHLSFRNPRLHTRIRRSVSGQGYSRRQRAAAQKRDAPSTSLPSAGACARTRSVGMPLPFTA